jgi:hypothetical protein
MAVPAWHLARLGSLSTAVAVTSWVAILGLVIGVVLLWRQHRAAPVVLITAFPLLAISPALIQPTLVGGSVMSPLAVGVAGLSFAAYLVGACWALSLAHGTAIDGTSIPLDELPRRRRKVLTYGLLVTAALVAVIVIGAAHLHPLGPDASQVRLLSGGALALWAAAYFWIIAPALRHRRPWPMSGPSRGAAIVWFLVVLVGLIMLAFAMGD